MARSEITVNELNGAFANHETARYLQSDGTIHIDIAGSTIAGTIDAYSVP